MGNSALSRPKPNVRERHSRALYINIPIKLAAVSRFIIEPCQADAFEGSCWLSIVVDDLDILESYCASGMFVSTGLQGWMVKTNLLVKCKVPTWNKENLNETTEVSGYQILSLDFEKGLGGNIKTLGARATQLVPTTTARFDMSSGPSGSAVDSALSEGLLYSAEVTSFHSSRNPLISIRGKFRLGPHDQRTLQLMEFAINRPNKFLKQVGDDYAGYTCTMSMEDNKGRLAFSPEDGDGADFRYTECVLVDVETLSLPILSRLDVGEEQLLRHIDISQAVCFVQPQYILVDHHNTKLN